MDAIHRAAFVSVGLTSGYGFLAVFCIVFGFMYAPALAAVVGGVLSLAWAIVLYVSGFLVRTKPYEKTHLWLMLEEDKRPPAEVAQRLISQILTETYRKFARMAAVFGGAFLAASIALHTVGFEMSAEPPKPKVRDFPIPAILVLPYEYEGFTP